MHLCISRTTFCDFEIRNLGDNIHKHSVQCALPINLFNEKFFICFWFWLITLFFLTFVNFSYWFRILFPGYRLSLVSKYLRTTKNPSIEGSKLFTMFVEEFCFLDGIFIFAILRRNSSYLTTADVVSRLFRRYSEDANVLRILMSREKENSTGEDSIKIGMIDEDDPNDKAAYNKSFKS